LNDIAPCLLTANHLDLRSTISPEGTLNDEVHGSEAEPDVRIVYISDLGRRLEVYKISRVHWWKSIELASEWFTLVRLVAFDDWHSSKPHTQLPRLPLRPVRAVIQSSDPTTIAASSQQSTPPNFPNLPPLLLANTSYQLVVPGRGKGTYQLSSSPPHIYLTSVPP
jgi:hypothetical protein